MCVSPGKIYEVGTRGARKIRNLRYIVLISTYASFDFPRVVNHHHDELYLIHIIISQRRINYYFIAISCYLSGGISLFFYPAHLYEYVDMMTMGNAT